MRREFNNQNEKRERKPISTTTYTMSCKTVVGAFDALVNAHPELDKAIDPEFTDDTGEAIKFHNLDYVKEEGITLYDMTLNVINYIQNNAPDIENLDNMRTSMSLKSNRVFVQTNNFVSFGWMVKYTKNGRKSAVIDSIDLMIILYGDKSVDLYERDLLDDGWTKKEEE